VGGISQAARDGTANDHRAGKALEETASRTWKQVRCVVVPERLVACGPPRNGIERPLAILLTNAQSGMLTGLAGLSVRSALAMLGGPGVVEVGAFPGAVRCFGRCVLRAERFDTNSLRCFGPTRASTWKPAHRRAEPVRGLLGGKDPIGHCPQP
jgi:hypothetical protein